LPGTQYPLRVELRYVYDNSAGNPRNPSSPPRRGTYGEETTDEMALLFLLVAVPRLEDAAAFNRAQAIGVIDRFFADGIDPVAMAPAQTRGLRIAFTHFDANHNGALEPEERTALLRFLRLIP